MSRYPRRGANRSWTKKRFADEVSEVSRVSDNLLPPGTGGRDNTLRTIREGKRSVLHSVESSTGHRLNECQSTGHRHQCGKLTRWASCLPQTRELMVVSPREGRSARAEVDYNTASTRELDRVQAFQPPSQTRCERRCERQPLRGVSPIVSSLACPGNVPFRQKQLHSGWLPGSAGSSWSVLLRSF
jgi:hypothetical protein